MPLILAQSCPARCTSVLLAALLGLAGCGSTTPQVDAHFGEAVLAARARQTLNPDAGRQPAGPDTMDGRAARESIRVYQDSFKTPPPAFNVINIGGGLTGGSVNP